MLCCVVLLHFDDGPAEKRDPEHVPEGTVGSFDNTPPPLLLLLYLTLLPGACFH